jgi:Na+/melibiose symporter-like transporter
MTRRTRSGSTRTSTPPRKPRPTSRDLRLLAGAVFLSAAGDLLALIVLALQVHELTRSGVSVSALFATTLVPMVALAPLAGLVADRFEGVRVLVTASLAQAAIAVALAFVSDLAAILALSSLLTAGNAFAQPAEFTLVPAVAGARRVTEATGVLEAARYAGFAAGPVVAAGLAALGPRPALLVTAGSFAAIAAAAGAMRTRRPPTAGTASKQDRALDGFRLLHHDRILRVTIAAAVGALLFISASLTVEVFYLKDVVGASDTAYALVVCGWMAGMVFGATALARRTPARLVAAAALVALGVQGAGMGVQAAWAVLPVAFAGYLVGGVGHGVKNVLLRALIAVRVPEAVHGRAFAAYNAARSTAELGAVGAGGVLVSALGPQAALVLAGLGPILAALAGLTALRPRDGVRRGRARPIGQRSWFSASPRALGPSEDEFYGRRRAELPSKSIGCRPLAGP